METPYGGLWYAAGNPDGFRFGSVNHPSPPLSRYRWNRNVNLTLDQSSKTRSRNNLVRMCLRIGRPSNRKTVPPYPPVGRRSLLDLPHHRCEPRFCRLGPPMCSFPQSGTEIAIILGPEALECLGVWNINCNMSHWDMAQYMGVLQRCLGRTLPQLYVTQIVPQIREGTLQSIGISSGVSTVFWGSPRVNLSSSVRPTVSP